MRFKKFGGPVPMGMAFCLAIFSGCGPEKSTSGYGGGHREIRARIRAEFTAGRPDGGDREFRTVTEAWIRLRKTDSLTAGFRMDLWVDSIRYASSERDENEVAFMQERLKEYRAHWKMDRKGRTTDLSEEPELPRGELTFRLGPGLAASLPVFTGNPTDTQSLFDPSDPSAILIQGNAGHGSKTCELKFSGSEGMQGEMKFTMDEKLGFPASIEVDVKGTLQENGDTATAAPLVGMRYQYAFRVTESVASP